MTIVMPTFDRGDYLIEAVGSVIGQTYRDWELIVVDDGSTDSSIERIEELGERRIRIVRVPHCGRIAKLRNIGAAAGSGDFIAFLDSDDLWLPNRLGRQLGALDESDAAWCCSNVGVIDGSGQAIELRVGRYSPASGRIARALLLKETAAWIITLLVPRRLFDQIGGFDEEFASHEDLDLAIRLAEAADGLALADTLALTRDHKGRTTRAMAYQHEQAALVYEKALARNADPGLAPAIRKRWSAHLADAARDRLTAGNLAMSLLLASRAITQGASVPRLLKTLAGAALRRIGMRGRTAS